MKQGLNPIPRPDLNGNTKHYETTGVEIENTKGKNILICCAYRQRNFDPEFGFRACHSINHALISLTESVKNSINIKGLGVAFFLI